MKARHVTEDSGFQPKRRRKYKKKSGKRRTLLKYVIVCILLLSAVIALAASPVFDIKKVEVRGNSHLSSEDIINTADIVLGNNGFKAVGNNIRNILSLRYGRVEESILKNQPYVRTVSARFSIPDKVVIDVTERRPLYAVPYMGANLLIDDEGYILDSVNKIENNRIFIVSGLKVKDYKKGQALKVENPDNISYIKKLTDSIGESDKDSNLKLADLITSIDLSDPYNIAVTFDSRITVNFNDLKELDYRLIFLRQIYFTQLKKEDKGFLDFTADGKYNFRPKK